MTQYVSELAVPGKPDLHILVVGPHDPPLDDGELTLGALVLYAAENAEHWQTTNSALPFYLPPWPH